MPQDSLLAWRVGEGGKKYTYEGKNQLKTEAIVHFSDTQCSEVTAPGRIPVVVPRPSAVLTAENDLVGYFS